MKTIITIISMSIVSIAFYNIIGIVEAKYASPKRAPAIKAVYHGKPAISNKITMGI